MRARLPPLPTTPPSSAPSATATFLLFDPDRHYAASGTSKASGQAVRTTRPLTLTPAVSAGNHTMLSAGLADKTRPSDHAARPHPADIFLAESFPFLPVREDHAEILDRITTPYNSDAFDALLDKHRLRDRYPVLTRNLREGSGSAGTCRRAMPHIRQPMPSLTKTNFPQDSAPRPKWQTLLPPPRPAHKRWSWTLRSFTAPARSCPPTSDGSYSAGATVSS
ncbi:hypothetical protein FB451DRAFT_1093521 [Mycena latifolia]|nr:hypothetical protein FB451DRAFT_1093521 [Mycena latifolia]